jgi:DNA polymerase
MSESINEILQDFESYLKFYKKNYNYLIQKDELKSDNIYELDIESDFSTDSVKDEFIQNYSSTKTENTDEDMAKKIAKVTTLEEWQNAKNLADLREAIKDCKKCPLWKTRTNFVFGEGNPKAKLVVIGEAPGADEDEQGKPFVGRAGKLLTEILKAVNFTREEVFICNILKSRPPNNRNPLPEEIEACEPYLFKQLGLIKPKLILCVGTFAAQTLLRSKEPLGKMRGKFHEYQGIPTMVTFHPAALLRNPNWKRPTWEDVQLLRKEYDKLVKN